MEKDVTLMKKGLDELQNLGSRRHTLYSGFKSPLSSTKGNPSKAAEAIKRYYEKTVDQTPTSIASGYISEIGELQKSFMRRPGCPEYSHRATSTSHLEGSTLKHFGLPNNLSTISLSSQLSLDDWNSIFSAQELKVSKNFMKHLAVSSTQSLSKLGKWKSCTEILPHSSQKSSPSGSKVPWYVAVLQEKDLALQGLAQKVVRLSNCEAECARKDDIISVLREEVEEMQKQMEQLQRGSVIMPDDIPRKKSFEKKAVTKGFDDSLRRRGVSLPVYWDQGKMPEEFRQEIERLKLELVHSDKNLESKVELLNQSLMEDQEQLDQLEKEYAEMQEKTQSASEEEAFTGTESGELEGAEETEEELIIRKFLELQSMNYELFEELEKVKNDYDVATGAISSLQRQLSFEGSQLRKTHTERDMLRKELRERGDQLEAMTNKFCDLREERKYGEMMGTIERENYKLRQDVSELESKLNARSQQIDELQNNVNWLQAELVVNQHHAGKQLSKHSDLQSQLEALQRVAQQTRVTLESISARFERFRSKIIQATYSTPGTKSPQMEITDEELLEALQKIITDRLDFYQMLKQKGVKLPALNTSEPSVPLSHKKKSPSR